jgi:hypothetical protein
MVTQVKVSLNVWVPEPIAKDFGPVPGVVDCLKCKNYGQYEWDAPAECPHFEPIPVSETRSIN